MVLLLQEKEEFIKEMKVSPYLSIKRIEDYYEGLGKAFDDAFNQYARREKKSYGPEKIKMMKPIIERMFAYFHSDEDRFADCFTACIDLSKSILDNNRYGIAQKFTNMAFKYLYCYSDADEFEEKFRECHMPLDKYTLRWVKRLKDTTINQRLGAIRGAWANIDKPLYDAIQERITETLNNRCTYTISFNKNATETTCILPEHKLYAEFIIWHQEKINEWHALIARAEKDFDRLGIQWI